MEKREKGSANQSICETGDGAELNKEETRSEVGSKISAEGERNYRGVNGGTEAIGPDIEDRVDCGIAPGTALIHATPMEQSIQSPLLSPSSSSLFSTRSPRSPSHITRQRHLLPSVPPRLFFPSELFSFRDTNTALNHSNSNNPPGRIQMAAIDLGFDKQLDTKVVKDDGVRSIGAGEGRTGSINQDMDASGMIENDQNQIQDDLNLENPKSQDEAVKNEGPIQDRDLAECRTSPRTTMEGANGREEMQPQQRVYTDRWTLASVPARLALMDLSWQRPLTSREPEAGYLSSEVDGEVKEFEPLTMTDSTVEAESPCGQKRTSFPVLLDRLRKMSKSRSQLLWRRGTHRRKSENV